MNQKKMLLLLICLFLFTALFLTGCVTNEEQGKQDPETGQTTDPTTEKEGENQTEQKVSFSTWFEYTGSEESDGTDDFWGYNFNIKLPELALTTPGAENFNAHIHADWDNLIAGLVDDPRAWAINHPEYASFFVDYKPYTCGDKTALLLDVWLSVIPGSPYPDQHIYYYDAATDEPLTAVEYATAFNYSPQQVIDEFRAAAENFNEKMEYSDYSIVIPDDISVDDIVFYFDSDGMIVFPSLDMAS